MAIPKCKLCGSYNGIAQWPAEERANYNPDICFSCAQKEQTDQEDSGESYGTRGEESQPDDDALEAQLQEDDDNEEETTEEEEDEDDSASD